MLFTYSPLAPAENWLSQTIVQILNDGMQSIIGGIAPPAWPEVIPVNYRPKLCGRHGIEDRLTRFWGAFDALERSVQDALLKVLVQQTSLPHVLSDQSACTGINGFPEGIRYATDDLFRFLFEKQLTTIKMGEKCLRDVHYDAIYAKFPARICPFCGLNYFRAPGAPRNALDHYMPISKYPFVGADFRNLPPMCSECNTDYKKDTDILHDDHDHRLRCVDPYLGPTFNVCLAESLPFDEDGSVLPRWKIQFIDGPEEQAENWNRVFKIRERYERDILNAEFRSWLKQFVGWYQGTYDSRSGNDIADSMSDYIKNVIQDGLADRAFLKAEVFRLLRNACADPDRGVEMKNFLEDLVANV